jgi:hypothetical protein
MHNNANHILIYLLHCIAHNNKNGRYFVAFILLLLRIAYYWLGRPMNEGMQVSTFFLFLFLLDNE